MIDHCTANYRTQFMTKNHDTSFAKCFENPNQTWMFHHHRRSRVLHQEGVTEAAHQGQKEAQPSRAGELDSGVDLMLETQDPETFLFIHKNRKFRDPLY